MVKILLVDDHPITRRGIRDILAGVCAKVSFGEAADGQEALELMAVQPWDLILLDLSMPRLGGFGVLKEMRRRHLEIPVLVLSVFAESEFRPQALKSGAAGYVSKQSSAEALRDAAIQLLQRNPLWAKPEESLASRAPTPVGKHPTSKSVKGG